MCAATAGCSGTLGGSQAECGGPAATLEASPARAAPGEPIRLHGEGFYGDFVCDDNGPEILSRPAGGRFTDGIRVEFVQGTRTWSLATVTSDEDLGFDARSLKVPFEAKPGEAAVRATSPPTESSEYPPQAETPFLVVDDLTGTADAEDRP